MTASPPSNTKTTKGNWLPWVIGIAVVLLLAWWLRGCGKTPETGAMADTTQSMMAPDTTPAPAPEAAPAPAPAQTATPAPAPSAAPTDTQHARTPHQAAKWSIEPGSDGRGRRWGAAVACSGAVRTIHAGGAR